MKYRVTVESLTYQDYLVKAGSERKPERRSYPVRRKPTVMPILEMTPNNQCGGV